MVKRPHVVVVGGGISGLAAAHELTRLAGDSVRVTVVERGPAVGGKLALGEVDGVSVDLGAESLLARRPEAVRLAERVGLAEDLVHPAASGAWIWSRGRLRRLPSGQLMGIPVDLRELAESEVLSLRGLARVPLDSVLSARPNEGDRSLGQYVAARLGREVVDRLVEPILGGVYAGNADDLSLDTVLPQLAGAVRVERSLLRSAARVVDSGMSGLPVFAGIRGGVARLATAVEQTLSNRSAVTVSTGLTVCAIERTPQGWRLVTGSTRRPSSIACDAVVLAVPAGAAARLLDPLVASAAEELREVPYASVGLVSLVVNRDDAHELPAGTGFLVPPVEGRLIKAATFSSQKWGWVGAQRPGCHVVRASIGRFGEEAALQRDDDDLVAAVAADLAGALGWPALSPVASTVTRWGGGLPQYLVGHLDRVSRIRRALTAHPGLAVCGAAYDGVGVPACIASGESAAALVLRQLGARQQ